MEGEMRERLTTAEIFERLQKPTVKLGFERAAEKLPLGASKFGGNPSAPRDFVWPFYRVKSDDGATANRPLTFLMQLNLEEIAPYDVEKRLPSRGLLAFFIERIALENEASDAVRVFYFDGPVAETVEIAPPPEFAELEDDGLFSWDYSAEFAITFEKSVSVPCSWDLVDYGIELAVADDESEDDAFERYEEERDALTGTPPNGDFSQALGIAHWIQWSMLGECERLAAGLSDDEFAALPADERAKIEENAQKWTLLCRLGSVCEEATQGDCGSFYFCVREDDLKRSDFSRVRVFFQCF